MEKGPRIIEVPFSSLTIYENRMRFIGPGSRKVRSCPSGNPSLIFIELEQTAGIMRNYARTVVKKQMVSRQFDLFSAFFTRFGQDYSFDICNGAA